MAAKRISEIDRGKLKTFLDRKIIKALGHEVREHILAVLNERIASPKEIADELETDVSFLDYHFEVLLDLGCVEIVDVKPRRGGNEHFYRAKATLMFDAEASAAIPESMRADLVANHVQSIWNEASQALAAGTFAVEGDEHVSWMPAILDRLGWEEVIAAMERLLLLLMQIQLQSAKRVALDGKPGMPVTIAMMGFGTAAAPLNGR